MIIHYNNGTEEKLLRNISYIGVIDGEHPVSVLTKSGKEYNIRLDQIEAILDDEIVEKDKSNESSIDFHTPEMVRADSRRKENR